MAYCRAAISLLKIAYDDAVIYTKDKEGRLV